MPKFQNLKCDILSNFQTMWADISVVDVRSIDVRSADLRPAVIRPADIIQTYRYLLSGLHLNDEDCNTVFIGIRSRSLIVIARFEGALIQVWALIRDGP